MTQATARARGGRSSLGNDGVSYPVPDEAHRESLWKALEARAKRALAEGYTVAVVQGLGFVGAVMTGVLANARREDGSPRYFVIGVDLPSEESYWKVAMLEAGRSPVRSEDPAVEEYVTRGHATGNLAATADERAYSLASVIVVDIALSVELPDGPGDEAAVRMAPFLSAIDAIGRTMRPDALVVIETTVPPGTTERVALPALERAFTARGLKGSPLLAHSYERVMPGVDYVRSIERFWRAYAGVSPAAADAAGDFLSSFIDTGAFPLTRLGSTTASELAKVMENSYRAMNIAFVDEWTRAAQDLGVNLYEVVDAIAVRKGTHDNIRRPGFGVGGYCLPKDGYLAQWGITQLFGADSTLSMTLAALRINRDMPRHTLDLLCGAMGSLAGKRVLVAGLSYRPDVADARYSPTLAFCHLLEQEGASPSIHDPFAPELGEIPFPVVDLAPGLREADAVVFAVRHPAYRALVPDDFVRAGVVIDAADVLTDTVAQELADRGTRVRGVGKGHWSGAHTSAMAP